MKHTIWHKFKFCGAHALPHSGIDCLEELHGHTWEVTLWITGPLHPEKGWVIDYAEVQAIWADKVGHHLGHLNKIKGLENPTSELIAVWIAKRIGHELYKRGVLLTRIRITEGFDAGSDYEL